jgi:hypothetical protein
MEPRREQRAERTAALDRTGRPSSGAFLGLTLSLR